MTDKNLREFSYSPRACASCLGSNEELLWNYDFVCKSREYQWKFKVRNIICKNCGFVFVSPCPDPNELLQYYGDSIPTFSDQAIDYSAAKRLEVIDGVENRNWQGCAVLEIGSNMRSSFHDELDKRFNKVSQIEPNSLHPSNIASISEVENGSMDLVINYFVLEHIPDITSFFLDCRRVLKDDGVLIIEVPDLMKYVENTSAIALYEHMNHFDSKSLSNIAARYGFSEIRSSNDLCSRSYGFVSVFKKGQVREPVIENLYLKNKVAFRAGLDLYRKKESIADEVSQLVSSALKAGESTIFWGANDNLLRFATSHNLNDRVIVVDSNSMKEDFLPNRKVYLPHAKQQAIGDASLVVICTNLHFEAISNEIKRMCDGKPKLPRMLCLDYQC